MVPLKGRLRRLEGRSRCPACDLTPDGPRRIAVVNEEYPEQGFDGDPDQRCGRCGRSLYTVLRVVYGDEEGGGTSY
jgi:hypothetical protein